MTGKAHAPRETEAGGRTKTAGPPRPRGQESQHWSPNAQSGDSASHGGLSALPNPLWWHAP